MKIKLSENEWETVIEKRIKVKGQFKFSQIRKIKEERERKRESKERRGMRKKERTREIKKEEERDTIIAYFHVSYSLL